MTAFVMGCNIHPCTEHDKPARIRGFLASQLRWMLDDLNGLKTFRAILAEGSLSAAARRLGVTLAMVSKRLSTLEGRAGVRLIHRSTRALSPTEEGARLLADLVHSSLWWSAAKPSTADRKPGV